MEIQSEEDEKVVEEVQGEEGEQEDGAESIEGDVRVRGSRVVDLEERAKGEGEEDEKRGYILEGGMVEVEAVEDEDVLELEEEGEGGGEVEEVLAGVVEAEGEDGEGEEGEGEEELGGQAEVLEMHMRGVIMIIKSRKIGLLLLLNLFNFVIFQ